MYISTRKNTKQQQKNGNRREQYQITVNIPLALMKQFNLFPVARGIVTMPSAYLACMLT